MSEVVWWLVLCLGAFCLHAYFFHSGDAGDALHCETYGHGHGYWHDCGDSALSWVIVLIVASIIIYGYNKEMSSPPPATAQMTKHVAKAVAPSAKPASVKKKPAHKQNPQPKAHKKAVGTKKGQQQQ